MSNQKKDLSQWYVVTTISGNEDSVVKNLKGKIEAYQLGDLIQDIKVIKDRIVTEEIFSADDVPSSMKRKQKNVTWETIEDKNGKVKYLRRKIEEKNRFYGYIFIKMIMTEEAWFTIRNTQLITGIIGSSGKNAKPIPVSEYEIEALLNSSNNQELTDEQKEEGISNISTSDEAIVVEKKEYVCNFLVNQDVKLIGNQMTGEIGQVKSINTNKGTLVVNIDMFGRPMEIELPFEDVELNK